MIERTLEEARRRLLEARTAAGIWEGELSSSALSTATASVALSLAGRNDLAAKGLAWLAAHQNSDGGFGDTTDSPSNISTTALCWAALGMMPGYQEAAARAAARLGPVEKLPQTIAARYGNDRTFSVPILTLCALAGRVPWTSVPPLPFELAALPRSWYPLLNLQVVSYALPALIAIGLVRHVKVGSWNPLKPLARGRVLRVLQEIQPSSGGFLEAVPLTSFVAMSLIGAGLTDHPVAKEALEFLTASARPDGSWAIDTNLATWLTTLSVEALGGDVPEPARVRDWLLAQQTREVHPYTGSAPGAWAWTDRPGGVPDADDTAGALLALKSLGEPAAEGGVRWLQELQNSDGGIPTFCRGWGKLPFDRSCPGITAHAIRAWRAWGAPVGRAVDYLAGAQRPDGSWVPLWFGNQANADEANPVYGTSRVLLCADSSEMFARGTAWLLKAQGPDGGFGTIEETALAVEALAARGERAAAEAGALWLARRTEGGTRFAAAPIGLYFARLWYSEKLYPLIFTVGALRRVLS